MGRTLFGRAAFSFGRILAIFSVMSLLAVLNPALAANAGGMGGGGMGGGGMGGGSSVIDPPVGALFKEPVQAQNASTTPGIVEINLEAKITPVNVNGTMANLQTYNGSYPGPAIRVKRGDTFKINLKNSLPSTAEINSLGFQTNITNLHTHGLHVSPAPPADWVMYDLMPGQTYYHSYDLSKVEPGTLNLYHPHRHGLVAEQYWAGLVGPLVVEDENPLLAGYETHIMVLKDISLSGSSPAPHSMMMDWMMGKEGDTIMVNGQVNPRLYTKTGQVQRWRIMNGSNARFYKVALDNHRMYLIGTDGGLLDKPYPVSELLLSPGERVDVLVSTSLTSGSYKFKALPYSRMSMGMGMMGSSTQTITLMTLTYNGKQTRQPLPPLVNSAARRLNVDTSGLTRRTMTLSMGGMNGYINGQDLDVHPYEFHSMLDTYEVWTIVNESGMDHPFHQHVNSSQILSITGGDANYASLHTRIPAWKDTVTVPANGSVTMLVPIDDYEGMTMVHCHILEHEDIGMAGMWHIGMMPMP